jgi:hypothetical protein
MMLMLTAANVAYDEADKAVIKANIILISKQHNTSSDDRDAYPNDILPQKNAEVAAAVRRAVNKAWRLGSAAAEATEAAAAEAAANSSFTIDMVVDMVSTAITRAVNALAYQAEVLAAEEMPHHADMARAAVAAVKNVGTEAAANREVVLEAVESVVGREEMVRARAAAARAEATLAAVARARAEAETARAEAETAEAEPESEFEFDRPKLDTSNFIGGKNKKRTKKRTKKHKKKRGKKTRRHTSKRYKR